MSYIGWIIVTEGAVANLAAIASMQIARRATAQAASALTLARFWRSIAICVANKAEYHVVHTPIRPYPPRKFAIRPRVSADVPETTKPS